MTAKTGVIYLLKDKLQFYSPYTGRVAELRFPPEVVRDLDVLNSEVMENTIKQFVTNSKISPFNLVIVLADNTYFVKDFQIPQHQKPSANSQPEITLEVLQKQAIEFIEHVPFDNVVSKSVPLKDGMRVCATNKEYYEAVAISFEHLGFTVTIVIPGLVLGNGLNLRPVLDQNMANMILQKVNSVKQYDLLGQKVFQPTLKHEPEEEDDFEPEKPQNDKPDRKRLFTLIGVFASLLIVLVIVFVQSQAPPTPPRQPAHANTVNPTTQPVLLQPVTGNTNIKPTTAETAAPVDLQVQNVTVEIVNSPANSVVAKNLATSLEIYKFKSVSTRTQNSVGSANTIVTFTSDITQSARSAVLSEVKKVSANVSVQLSQNGIHDITIVIGQ